MSLRNHGVEKEGTQEGTSVHAGRYAESCLNVFKSNEAEKLESMSNPASTYSDQGRHITG